MSAETDYGKFFSKKAYEIAYALFRISSAIKRGSFGDHLENKGLALLSAATAGDYAGSLIVSRGIEYILKFGEDMGLVHPANSQAVMQELGYFNAAIAEFEPTAKERVQEINLDRIFSKAPVSLTEDHSAIAAVPDRVISVNIGHNDAELVQAYSSGNGDGNGNLVKSAMRQSAILERIRQNSDCRLKDIQEFLPEVSERTIRYDIQNLIEQGFVERLGNGGPATHYKVRSQMR